MVVLEASDFEHLRALAEDGGDVAAALAIEARIKAGERTIPGDVVRMIIVEDKHPIAAWRRLRPQPGGAGAAGRAQPGLDQPHRTRRRPRLPRNPPPPRGGAGRAGLGAGG